MASTHAEHTHHIMPVKTYLVIWGALLVLTAITVLVAKVDFGPLNVVIAIAVATVKAALVALYFMHLKYDNLFNRIIFFSSVIFLGLFLGLTLLDSGSREQVEPTQFAEAPILPQVVAPAPPPPSAH